MRILWCATFYCFAHFQGFVVCVESVVCVVSWWPSGLVELHSKLLTNRIPNVFPHFAATHKRKSWVTVHPQKANMLHPRMKPWKMIFRIQRGHFQCFFRTKQLISSTRQRFRRMHLNKFSTSCQFRESPAASDWSWCCWVTLLTFAEGRRIADTFIG